MKTSILQFLLAAVEEKLADKSAEFNTLAQRMNNLEKGSHDYDDLEWKLVQDNYIRVKEENGKLFRENQNLIDSTDRRREENYALREHNKDYTLERYSAASRSTI